MTTLARSQALMRFNQRNVYTHFGVSLSVPTYTYTCTACNDVIEKRQSFSDAPLTTCEQCGGTLRKVIHPVGIVFKGSGWYITDSRSSSSSSSSSSGSGSSDSGSKESGSKDSGSKDSGSKDSGSRDSGSRDSGSKDSGSKESGSKDSAPKPSSPSTQSSASSTSSSGGGSE